MEASTRVFIGRRVVVGDGTHLRQIGSTRLEYHTVGKLGPQAPGCIPISCESVEQRAIGEGVVLSVVDMSFVDRCF